MGPHYVGCDNHKSCEDKDTSNSCEDKIMCKRPLSAAAKMEVHGLQDVRERLAKMLGYKVHHAKKTTTTTITETKRRRRIRRR